MTTSEIDPKIILSGPTEVDIFAYKGDTGRFRITASDEDGNPVDISAATWDGDIRLKANDPTAIATFEITPVVGDPSSVDVFLSATMSEQLPRSCYYDIEMRQGEDVNTLIYGKMSVTQDVSRP